MAQQVTVHNVAKLVLKHIIQVQSPVVYPQYAHQFPQLLLWQMLTGLHHHQPLGSHGVKYIFTQLLLLQDALLALKDLHQAQQEQHQLPDINVSHAGEQPSALLLAHLSEHGQDMPSTQVLQVQEHG